MRSSRGCSAITDRQSAEDGFTDARIPIDPGIAARLRAGESVAAAELTRVLTRAVAGPTGFGVITGLHELDEAAARAFVVAASGLLGELVAQDAQGALLRDVRYRGVRLGEGATGRYSDSRDGGDLHTDGPHLPADPPDLFALYCVQQAPVGGGLVLVHLDDLLAGLSVDAVRTLGEPYHFDRRTAGVAAPTVVRPVLAGRRITYLRTYIELGHAHPHVPDLTPRQRAALDELDTLLNDPGRWRTGRLAPGEMVLVDNRVVCHGRTAFEDGPGEGGRLMLRTWIRRPAGVAR